MREALMRHIRACRNADLPGGRHRFLVAGEPVGWVSEATAALGATLGAAWDGQALSLAEGASLLGFSHALAGAGGCRHRSEPFDVRASWDGPVLGEVDRGALPVLGIAARGVHVNGLVRRGGETLVWVARRAAHKALDPSKLDHLIAGGISAGMNATETLAKEGEEEAGVPASIAATARPVAIIDYAMERPEGLRRDRLHCFDLELDAAFRPIANDGEVEGFELWPLERALSGVRETDDFKFNVTLVLIDLFLREGLVAGEEAVALRAALDERA